MHGGGSTWVVGSYDPDLDVIYWGGNPGPDWDNEYRPGDNLYSNSVLALDADTGKINGISSILQMILMTSMVLTSKH